MKVEKNVRQDLLVKSHPKKNLFYMLWIKVKNMVWELLKSLKMRVMDIEQSEWEVSIQPSANSKKNNLSLRDGETKKCQKDAVQEEGITNLPKKVDTLSIISSAFGKISLIGNKKDSCLLENKELCKDYFSFKWFTIPVCYLLCPKIKREEILGDIRERINHFNLYEYNSRSINLHIFLWTLGIIVGAIKDILIDFKDVLVALRLVTI